jgi:GntR family transcriptional regulator
VLTARCVEAVMGANLETGSLHDALISDGVVPTRGKSTIRAEAASDDDALLLGVHAGTPMLVERRLIYDQRGRPIERTESRYAADRYGLNVGFSVEDAGSLTNTDDV